MKFDLLEVVIRRKPPRIFVVVMGKCVWPIPSIFQGRCRRPESNAVPWLEWPDSSSALLIAMEQWSNARASANE